MLNVFYANCFILRTMLNFLSTSLYIYIQVPLIEQSASAGLWIIFFSLASTVMSELLSVGRIFGLQV